MCEHRNIILVTEQPFDEKGESVRIGINKTFVECADCGKILPINSVIQELRRVSIS